MKSESDIKHAIPRRTREYLDAFLSGRAWQPGMKLRFLARHLLRPLYSQFAGTPIEKGKVSRQNENVTLLSKVKMSPLAGEVCERVLVLMRPRGVAPERMPKADATELAPE
jgi:hypothetical protein